MRPDEILLVDMLLSARDAVGFLGDSSQDDFAQDRMRQMAVVKAIEIVGEAASRLTQAFRDEHAELPWHEIVGMRHRLVHDYFGIDVEQIWRTTKKDLPENEHFVQEIEITFNTVVMAEVRNGNPSRWKNLSAVWDFSGEEAAFKQYLEDEASAFFGGHL